MKTVDVIDMQNHNKVYPMSEKTALHLTTSYPLRFKYAVSDDPLQDRRGGLALDKTNTTQQET